MSKTNVLVYFDLTGGTDESLETVKEKAAFLRGRVGNRAVMLRDARRFDEVEPRVAIALLLGSTSSTALESVYEAYQKVGVSASGYDEFIRGEGSELTDEDEGEDAGVYLGRLKAQATERGITFGDSTTADELEMLIRHHDEDAKERAEATLREFEELAREADELGVAYEESFTNDQLRADIEAARATRAEADEALKALRVEAVQFDIEFTDETSYDDLKAAVDAAKKDAEDKSEELAALREAAAKLEIDFTDETSAEDLAAAIDAKVPAFDVETADFDALKAKAESLEIAYPSNIGEATLRKKIADHLKGE